MLNFILTLLVMLTENFSIPDKAGGAQKEKPPDNRRVNGKAKATAYYWDMYGARA